MPDVPSPARHAASRPGRGGRHAALRDEEIYEPTPSRRVPIIIGAVAAVALIGATAAAIAGGRAALPVISAGDSQPPVSAQSTERPDRAKERPKTPSARPGESRVLGDDREPPRSKTGKGSDSKTAPGSKSQPKPTTEPASEAEGLNRAGAEAFVEDFLEALDHGNRTGDYDTAGYLSRDCNTRTCIAWRVRDSSLRDRALRAFEPAIDGRTCRASLTVAFTTSQGTRTDRFAMEMSYADGDWHVVDLK